MCEALVPCCAGRQVLEGMAKDGLEPNEYSLVMVLQAANYKSKGLHKVRGRRSDPVLLTAFNGI